MGIKIFYSEALGGEETWNSLTLGDFIFAGDMILEGEYFLPDHCVDCNFGLFCFDLLLE